MNGTKDKGQDSQIHKQLPQHREHRALQYIRQDARLEPAPKEAPQALQRNDRLGRLPVPDARLVHLPVRLDDAQGVRDGVRDDRRAEPDERLAQDRAEERGRLGERVGEEVVGCEPLCREGGVLVRGGREGRGAYGVVSGEVRGGRGDGAIPQRADTIFLDLQHGQNSTSAHEAQSSSNDRDRTRTLCLRILSPSFPSVCIVVLTVSTGVKTILNAAAAALAKTVLINDGRFFRYPLLERSARMPAFAAVSPNRESGPWMSAAVSPW